MDAQLDLMTVARMDGRLVVEHVGSHLPAAPIQPATGALVVSVAKRGGRSPFASMSCNWMSRPGLISEVGALVVRSFLQRKDLSASTPYMAPRSTVMEKGAVAFTVPVNISPSL